MRLPEWIPAKVAIFLVIFCMPILGHAQKNDATIRFYLKNIDSVFAANYIFNYAGDFSCKARCLLHMTDYRGVLKNIDTAVYQLFYNRGKLDSLQIIDSAKAKGNIMPDSLHPLLPWKDSNSYYFFPNDTGAGSLAIGFEPADTTRPDLPAGFLNLNRNDYTLEYISLAFPRPKDYERASRSYRFERLGQHIILIRQESNNIKLAFLGRQYIKRIYEFYDYQIR